MPEPTLDPASAAEPPAASALSPEERRRARKRRFQRIWFSAYCMLGFSCFVIFLLLPDTTSDYVHAATLGGGIGALITMAVCAFLLHRGRRGYDSAFARQFDGIDDERDQEIARRAWKVVGIVGYAGACALGFLAAIDAVPLRRFAIGLMFLEAITLLGATIYYRRQL